MVSSTIRDRERSVLEGVMYKFDVLLQAAGGFTHIPVPRLRSVPGFTRRRSQVSVFPPQLKQDLRDC